LGENVSKHTYKKGYLKVTDGHKLYYELFGNPKGSKVIFLHGGPGSNFKESHLKMFNPKKHHVVFFDQRGAGRSKPHCSTKQNTTWKLIEDINAFYDFMNWDKAALVGGSWGTTLGLAYAINHPEKVTGMVLSSSWLGDHQDIKHYVGGGVQIYYPEAWERFISIVPKQHHKNPMSYYARKFKSKSKKEREKYLFEWAWYELSMVSLDPSEKQIKNRITELSFKSLATLEAHYLMKNCFLPRGYILKNANKLKNIPITFLQGRYDSVCQLQPIYKLHKKLPISKMYISNSAHAGDDPVFKKRRKKALNNL
jgi:proline iminopeptidase